jgi:hypothetical protein
MAVAPSAPKDSMKIVEFASIAPPDKSSILHYKNVYAIKLLIYIGMDNHVHYANIHNTGILETCNV